MIVDIEALRDYLKNYYGTAVFAGMPMALIDVAKIERASYQELIEIAKREHIDFSLFEISE